MRGALAVIVVSMLGAAVAAAGCGTSAEAAAGSYPIVDTGQVSCYDEAGSVIDCPEDGDDLFGQDASYAGNEAAYLDNGDGTVTDLVTGLMWQQDPGDKATYAEAVAGAAAFELAGYDDWRLPTIGELCSLIDFSGTDPSGCQSADQCDAVPFIDTDYFAFEYGDTSAGERLIDSQWVSATVYEGLTMGGDDTVFGVNFADGRIKGYPISDPQGGEKTFFVIHVRGNPEYGENEFVDNGDGTIADEATGLMWQRSDSGAGMEWADALSYCEALDVGGYDDWALPDVKQLQSIVDYTRSPSATASAAIDPVFEATVIVDEGGGDDYGFYWSSTTHASLQDGSAAAYVAFGEALGWMQGPQGGDYTLIDVHGAGAQRSDPKTGDADDYPFGRGPQGDVVRIDNLVRCVRVDEDASAQPSCDGIPATVVGTGGDDVLRGTDGDDVIWSGPGDDWVAGRGGDDTICLGLGDDYARGGLGDDRVWGGPGGDEIHGAGHADVIYGEAGDDILSGGAFADLILGGDGADTIAANLGADEVEAGEGDDVVRGGPGPDRLAGGPGDDTLYGGSGNDLLSGEGGFDALFGGRGADTCEGGESVHWC